MNNVTLVILIHESLHLGNLISVRKVTKSGSKDIGSLNFIGVVHHLIKRAVTFQIPKLKLKVLLFSSHA